MSISITLLDAAISALMVKEKIDYVEGDVEVNGSDHLNSLVKLRESILKNPEAELDVMAFDFDINEFGTDNTQYEL